MARPMELEYVDRSRVLCASTYNHDAVSILFDDGTEVVAMRSSFERAMGLGGDAASEDAGKEGDDE